MRCNQPSRIIVYSCFGFPKQETCDSRSPRPAAVCLVVRIGREPRDRFRTNAACAALDSGHRHGVGFGGLDLNLGGSFIATS